MHLSKTKTTSISNFITQEHKPLLTDCNDDDDDGDDHDDDVGGNDVLILTYCHYCSSWRAAGDYYDADDVVGDGDGDDDDYEDRLSLEITLHICFYCRQIYS